MKRLDLKRREHIIQPRKSFLTEIDDSSVRSGFLPSISASHKSANDDLKDYIPFRRTVFSPSPRVLETPENDQVRVPGVNDDVPMSWRSYNRVLILPPSRGVTGFTEQSFGIGKLTRMENKKYKSALGALDETQRNSAEIRSESGMSIRKVDVSFGDALGREVESTMQLLRNTRDELSDLKKTMQTKEEMRMDEEVEAVFNRTITIEVKQAPQAVEEKLLFRRNEEETVKVRALMQKGSRYSTLLRSLNLTRERLLLPLIDRDQREYLRMRTDLIRSMQREERSSDIIRRNVRAASCPPIPGRLSPEKVQERRRRQEEVYVKSKEIEKTSVEKTMSKIEYRSQTKRRRERQQQDARRRDAFFCMISLVTCLMSPNNLILAARQDREDKRSALRIRKYAVRLFTKRRKRALAVIAKYLVKKINFQRQRRVAATIITDFFKVKVQDARLMGFIDRVRQHMRMKFLWRRVNKAVRHKFIRMWQSQWRRFDDERIDALKRRWNVTEETSRKSVDNKKRLALILNSGHPTGETIISRMAEKESLVKVFSRETPAASIKFAPEIRKDLMESIGETSAPVMTPAASVSTETFGLQLGEITVGPTTGLRMKLQTSDLTQQASDLKFGRIHNQIRDSILLAFYDKKRQEHKVNLEAYRKKLLNFIERNDTMLQKEKARFIIAGAEQNLSTILFSSTFNETRPRRPMFSSTMTYSDLSDIMKVGLVRMRRRVAMEETGRVVNDGKEFF